jgi:hypothetical protein
MLMKKPLLLVCLLVSFIVGPALQARSKPAPTAPGKYKEWGPDIDEIEIVKALNLSDYDKIVVVPFDTSASPLPDKSEKSYNSIKSVLEGYSLTLAEALRKELKAKAEVETANKAPKSSKTLIISGKVLDLSPGSRAKRYIGGFGAGAAGTKLSGELVDAKTGNVLIRFTQERRSGGSFKFAGGNDMDVMRDSIHAEGQDIAHILDAFAK